MVISESSRKRGFTLIELLITIAILVMLLLVGIPFTSEWVDGTRQVRVRSNLIEAVGQARAFAMRNPYGHPVSDSTGNPFPIALLRVEEIGGVSTLEVFRRSADGSWGETPVWVGRLFDAPGLQLKTAAQSDFSNPEAFEASTEAFKCAAFDSRGRQQEAPGCAPPRKHRVAIGLRNQAIDYVDLL